MANPFAGTITGKNTGHANQANLVYAFIPRSTTEAIEAVNSASGTFLGTFSAYDADGYLRGNSNTITEVIRFSGGLALAGTYTLIVGGKYFGSANGATSEPGFWIYRSGESYIRAALWFDSYGSGIRPNVSDGSLTWLPGFASISSGYNFAAAISSKPGTQKGGYIAANGLNGNGGVTGTYTALSGDTDSYSSSLTSMGVLELRAMLSWGLQYAFVYNAELSDADREAIIGNPGAVLSYGSGQTLLPSSDITTTGWTSSAGGALYAAIDEAVASDTDYIYSGTINAECEIKLQPGSTPGAGSKNLKVRCPAGFTPVGNWTVSLYEGASLVQAFTTPAPQADTTVTFSVTNAITDYSDLRVRIKTNA